MGKGRFEAFSDGVFAIAITLLVLEIHLPVADTLNDGQMQHYLVHLWPQLVTYMTSFATIGIIWLNHHSTFVHVQSLDHVTLSLNLVLLLTVCFVPFPTALVAKYGALPSSTALYGATLTAMGISYAALWYYTARQEYRRSPSTAPHLNRITVLKGMAGTGGYFAGTLVAFVAPRLSALLFVSVAIYYAIPGRLETARRGTPLSK
jgi:uncharacterized membrane protein